MDNWVALGDVAGGALKAVEERRLAHLASTAESQAPLNDDEIRGQARRARRLNE